MSPLRSTSFLFLSLVLSACAKPPGGAVETPAPGKTDHVHGGERPSVHGMVLLGQERQYLSHLPMYHSPHDFQVLLEVALVPLPGGADPTAVYLADSAATGAPLYTIVPERMALQPLQHASPDHPVSFDAEVVRGHFERGGKTIVDRARVVVSRVIAFRTLKPNTPRPDALTYIVFGREGETFMAHQIAGRPDFDHLLRVQFPSGSVTDDELAAGVAVTLPGRTMNEPLAVGETVHALTPDAALPMPVTIVTEHYLEFGDLAF